MALFEVLVTVNGNWTPVCPATTFEIEAPSGVIAMPETFATVTVTTFERTV
jgi:hypothetical protein